MDQQQSKYLDLFISEAREHLDSLDSGLIDLEKDTQDTKAAAEVMRHAHTLKGIAASVGYGEISNLAHSFEGMVENVKNKIASGGFQILFGAIDELRRLVDQAETQGPTMPANPLVDEVGEMEVDDLAMDQELVAKPETFKAISEIRVRTDKLDKLMDLVGEIMVNNLRLNTLDLPKETIYHQAIKESNRLIEGLQYQVLQLRMTPIAQVFNRFPRMIRDLAKKQNKDIEFNVKGEEIELDRSILDSLGEPLVHMLRNAADHGIVDKGTINLVAERVQNQVVITIQDTGRGIDWEELKQKKDQKKFKGSLEDFLFSGITTAEKVTDISGRGIGLSVVKSIVESHGGNISIKSAKGEGTTFKINLPVSLAIIKSLLIEVNNKTYSVPLDAVERILNLKNFELKTQADQKMIVVDDTEVPLISLNKVLKLHQPDKKQELIKSNICLLVQIKEKVFGLIVDKVISHQDIIVKPVAKSLREQIHISAVTILGDGQPIPILDIESIIESTYYES